MITETLGALGSWSLTLDDTTPDEVLREIGLFGHIVILRGDVDVTQSTTAAVLAAARYVGVLRDKPGNSRVLEGASMRFWLGDEDNKGKVRESKLVFTTNTLTFCVSATLPPAVHVGTIHDPGGTYTGTHQWETPRQTLDTITAAFGVEYRVNGNGTVDVGTQAQLYAATPDSILSARGSGADMDVQSLGTSFQPTVSGIDYTTRAVLLGQTQDNATIVEATADAATVPYLDMFGNTVAFTRMISDSGQTTGSATAAAQLALNHFNRTVTTLKVTADDYDTQGNFVVGDNSYVFDPDNGIVDTTRELDFRGERINPAVVRISGTTWPVTEGHTVCFRAQDGTLLDLTRWVVWESGTTDITVGDLPKTLLGAGGNPVQDRANSVPDTSVPGPPTGLTLSTTSVLSTKGQSTATVSATWLPPATNTDGTVVTDLAYYVVHYRWQGRAPQWDTRYVPDATIDIPALSVGLVYDVQVAAVDLAGHVSAFTAVASITAAPDTTAPNPPADPTVTSYLGQLRIYWSGLDNVGGAMPADFAIVEVHVSATSGFTPSTATLVSQLSTAGAAYATAPYGAARYVKLVSVDNSGNRSAPSGQVTGTTVQAGDGDIAALSVGKLTAGTMSADVIVGGRFATALTGGRVEMNSLGFQKFDVDGVTKLVSLTGTEALLTGIFKTAITGRRIEIGSGGSSGRVSFFAPDGTLTFIEGWTSPSGPEGIHVSIPTTGVHAYWNSLNLFSNGLAFIDADTVHFGFNANGTNNGNFQVQHATSKGNATTQPTMVVRFQIDPTTLSYYGSDGGQRLVIKSDGSSEFIYPNGGTFRVSQIDGSGTQKAKFAMLGDDGTTSGTYYFQWATSAVQMAQFIQSTNISVSTKLSLIHPFGGGIYGLHLSYVAASADGTSDVRIEFRDASDAGFVPLWATSFVVSSSKAGKNKVAPFTVAAMDKLRPVGLKKFRRKGAPSQDGKIPAVDGPEEFGVIAEEVPEEMVTRDENGAIFGVDLPRSLWLVLAGLQETEARVAALEKGRAA